MMDNNDERLSMTNSSAMNDIHTEQVLMSNMSNMSNIELLPNIADEQLMQLLGNQHYMMTDGSHLNENQRNVNPIHNESVNSGHNSTHSMSSLNANVNPMDRHSVDSCNYVSAQYEPQYHDSSHSQHRYKYGRSSGLSSGSMTAVSETVTHVSETDNSISGQNSYGSVGASVPNMNVPQTYPMTSVNNWNHSHSNINANQIRAPKEMTAINIHQKVTPQSCYIPRQRISNFVQNVTSMAPSTTSTPVNQTLNNMVINNHMNTDNNSNKNNSLINNQDLQQSNKIEFPHMAEKRTVITFRVVDQIVDHSGKVLKETVIKDEEVVKNLGKVQWTDSITPQSSISSVSRFVSNNNSGVLADVSSSVKSTSSTSSALLLENLHNRTNDNLLKTHSANDDFFNKIPTPIVSTTINSSFPKPTDFNQKLSLDMRSPIISTQRNNESVTAISGKKVEQDMISSEIEEEERRETATALLSLQTQRSLNIDCNSSEQMLSKNVSLRAGNRVMAKWRDKSFYPAVISKYLPQNNKWSVTFEDKATRNLFETELIHIECLNEGQDVMVSISDGFCAKAVIKGVINEDNDILFEVEHIKDDKKVLKRYGIKDLFLNAEQGANIALKSAKPVLNGAVFADVDLDNIVSGKRARITKQENTEKPMPVQTFKNGRRRPAADSVSIDVDYVNDEEEEDDTFPVKSKKKAINIRANKKKVESLHMNFHSEHSLSISPRTTKASISMPPQELIKLLGPLPETGSNIFNGVSFILTCGDRNKCDDLCLEESNPERSTPFDKFYLIKQIESGGGKVFETFEDMRNFEDNVDIVLIADTYHRSIKYIQCLAAGIPIASHLWVIDCCRQNKYLKRDSYTLPAGFSIITNALPSDKNTFRKSSTLFKGTKFYFGSKTPEKLQSLWSPVLSAAHAVIVENNSSLINSLTRKTVDIIIGDPSCPIELVKKAKQMKIPVISSEYIVQCLINGRKLSYDASPLFSYTYKNNSNL